MNGDCAACPEDVSQWHLILVMLFIFAFLVGVHHLTDINPDVDAGSVKSLGTIIAIAIGHVQISMQIISLPSIPWPSFLPYVPNVILLHPPLTNLLICRESRQYGEKR